MKTFSIEKLSHPRRYLTWWENDKANTFCRKKKGSCLSHWLLSHYSSKLKRLLIDDYHYNWEGVKRIIKAFGLNVREIHRSGDLKVYSITEIKRNRILYIKCLSPKNYVLWVKSGSTGGTGSTITASSPIECLKQWLLREYRISDFDFNSNSNSIPLVEQVTAAAFDLNMTLTHESKDKTKATYHVIDNLYKRKTK